MLHIFVVIAFSYLAVKFFSLAVEVAWGFAKVTATALFLFAIPAFFLFVIINSTVFLLLPIGFILTAVDLVTVPGEVKGSCQ